MSGTDPAYPEYRGDENDENLGMDLVDQVSTDAENTRKPVKKWVLGVSALAIILLGIIILVANLIPKDYVSKVEGAKDKVVVQADLKGGGQAVLSTSAKADAGSIALSQLPAIDPTERYSIWLIATDTDRPTLLKMLDAGAESANAGFNGVSDIASVMVSLEPAQGSTTPSSEPLVILDTTAGK